MKPRNVLQSVCLLLILIGAGSAKFKLMNQDVSLFFYVSGAIGLILVMLLKVLMGDFRKKETLEEEHN